MSRAYPNGVLDKGLRNPQIADLPRQRRFRSRPCLQIFLDWSKSLGLAKLLQSRLIRFPVVALALLGWLATSNHCALAGLAGASKTSMRGCHGMAAGRSAPAKDGQPGVDCCKVLRATLSSLAKNGVAAAQVEFVLHAYMTALLPLLLPSAVLVPAGLDTGPPAGGFFVESVLQRSLLAHAPPFLA